MNGKRLYELNEIASNQTSATARFTCNIYLLSAFVNTAVTFNVTFSALMTTPEEKWRDFNLGDEYYSSMLPYSAEVYKVVLNYCRRLFGNEKIPFAIDCASGSGQVSERLANDCTEVLAFDLSPQQIEVGIRNSKHSNVTYKVSSVYEMSQLIPKNHPKADLMTCNASSHYFNNSRFYDEVRKCLRYGGILAESIGNFDRFLECDEENYRPTLDLVKKVITDNASNPEYNRMFEVTDSGYQLLDVLLENVERVESHCDFYLTLEDFVNYIMNNRSKARALREEAISYFEVLWKKYSKDSIHLTARFKVFVVFSQNLKKD